jgi:NAD(P)H-flavin reductase
MRENIYLPQLATIREIREETADTAFFTAAFDEPAHAGSFNYRPGQFVEVTVFGSGECPVSIASSPTRDGTIELCVRETGEVTGALHQLSTGDRIGVRGPYGNSFPVEETEGRDILFVGGGIGLAPLRSLLWYMLDNRERYGRIDVVYGAKTPEDLCFQKEYGSWGESGDTGIHITVDRADGKWSGKVGLVTAFLQELGLPPRNRVAFVCGPPIMIKVTALTLLGMGYDETQVVTTLERKMRCGVGKCGRCSIGDRYVCRDGPVFNLSELKQLTE